MVQQWYRIPLEEDICQRFTLYVTLNARAVGKPEYINLSIRPPGTVSQQLEVARREIICTQSVFCESSLMRAYGFALKEREEKDCA